MLKPNEKILLISDNLWMLGEGMLGPLFAVFALQINGSLLNITWAWATYLIVAGVLHVAVGKLCDELKKPEKLAVFGLGLNVIFTFAYLLVDSPAKLFIVQAGLGIAMALANPPWYSLYARQEDVAVSHHSAFKWGLWKGTTLIVTGLAVVIGGFIVNNWGFRTLFIIMGCVQVFATLYQAKLLSRSS